VTARDAATPGPGEIRNPKVANIDPLTIVLEGKAIQDISSFYAEINRVFMAGEDWQLAQSLDALDDMLYGGYGVLAGHSRATVVWRDMEQSRASLGLAATRDWLQAKLDSNAFNRTTVARQLQALNSGEGQTYFQIVMEIFAGHPSLTLVSG